MANPQIVLPELCKTHQVLLVHQAGYKETDPWRALIIATQIALFQGATADPSTHERIGGLIERLPELGCLACYKPDKFGEIVEAAKSHDIGEIKKLGESWLNISTQ